MANLYSPPTWRNVFTMEGSLRAGITTQTTTYRVGGVWFNTQAAGTGQLDGADQIFSCPTIVSDVLAAQLIAFGVGTVTIV